MRPTGRLHLGHYFGALINWLKLQEEYDCFYFVADWHALTTHYQDTSSVAENTLEVVTDWLAAGLDPNKSTLFVQSRILEHAELHVLLSMITPLSWLERVPTYKEQIENLKDRDLGTYGFLGYPLLQSADIVMYGEPQHDLLVPVGEDQAPHVELTREVVRKFNSHFGFEAKKTLFDAKNAEARAALAKIIPLPPDIAGRGAPNEETIRKNPWVLKLRSDQIGFENFLKEVGKHKKFFRLNSVLREPSYVTTATPRLPGLDGRRMAKSYGNAVWLSDPPDEIRSKVRNMMTDPQRQRRTDPGRPEVCPVFAWHKLFSTPENGASENTIAQIDRDCRSAAIGCVDCKKIMAEGLVRWIEPIQTRRREWEAHPQKVWDVIGEGSKAAQKTARRTMKRVRNAVFHWDEAKPS
jgi:tryptophanyl-tRNA synthetase